MRKTHSSLIAAASAVVLALGGSASGQGILKNDIAFGLSNGNAANAGGVSVDIARGQPTAVNTGLLFNGGTFSQSMEFDHLDGIRHNPKGNLLGLTFGTTAGGGTIWTLDTRHIASPGGATEFFTFADYNAANPSAPLSLSRLGGLSVSPNNGRLAFTGSDSQGVYVLDYTAGDRQGAGAAVSNGRELVGILRSGSTQGSAWIDNDNLLVADGFGQLQVVNAAGPSLSSSVVGSFAIPSTTGNPFTSVAYEPTISPLVYVSVSQFTGAGGTPPNTTVNRLYAFDPAAGYAQVGSIDFSTSSQTARELAFDSNGNLYISQFGSGTITASVDVFRNAFDLTSLTNDSSLDYYTSAATASFNGVGAAMARPDYLTSGVNVNLRNEATVVEYFTATSPLATIAAKVASGYAGGAWTGPGIASSNAASTPGTGIGYRELTVGESVRDTFAGGAVTVGRSSVYVAYTLLGDANVDRVVNIADFSTLAANFNLPGNWSRGDFNYDGTVGIADFSALAANFNQSIPTDLPRGVVPEPTTAALALLATATLLRRRQRAA